jgi:hypothetical protein
VENILSDPESNVQMDDDKLFDGEAHQIIIVNPEEHQQMLEDEQAQQKQQNHGETDNHEKINGQFIEVTADGEELAGSFSTYSDLVKSINDEDEFDEVPRISEERPLTDTNSFDEFMAASKLISSDIGE